MNPNEIMTLESDADFDEFGIEVTIDAEELTAIVDLWEIRARAVDVAHREAIDRFFNSWEDRIEESTHSFLTPVPVLL